MGLNWFIPAFVKRSVGSSYGTHGEEGQEVWPGVSGRWMVLGAVGAAGLLQKKSR